MRDLLGHRFVGGSLDGHTMRNLLFTALEQMTASTSETVVHLHDVFRVHGRVLPVTHGIALNQDILLRGTLEDPWRFQFLAVEGVILLVLSWLVLRRSLSTRR